MHATTVAIDVAKDVFELVFAGATGHITERKRLTRRAFAHCLALEHQHVALADARSLAGRLRHQYVAVARVPGGR